MPALLDEPARAARPLLEFARERVESGQARLAHYVKHRLGESGHPAAATLDYSDDETFLDPLLFACLGRPDAEETLGPILEESLSRDETRPIAGTDLTWTGRLDPLYRQIVESASPDCRLHGCESPRIDFSGTISRAFQILETVSPALHELLLAVTRQVVTFTGEGIESFATLSAHGAVFLNTDPAADEIFFVEDLVHQGGHLLFNAITLDRSELLSADPDTPFGEMTGDPDEKRSLHVALHGVFTESLIALALASCLDLPVLAPRQSHELKGRLSFIMKRMELDLLDLRGLDVFTETGASLVRSFEETFDSVYATARDSITRFDLGNQAYAFRYDRFAELNPIPSS